MLQNERAVRYRPPVSIPSQERFIQMERLLEAVWETASILGLHIGQRPTPIITGDGLSGAPIVLGKLAQLEIEVGATVLMCGLGDAITRAIFETAKDTPHRPNFPNYRIIVDDSYPEEEDETVNSRD